MKVGEVLDGDFELVRCIGGGGMGSVWEARQLSSDQRVAIKALHEHLLAETDLVARFLREARAALESRYSAHIIQVIAVVSPPDAPPYQVMEYLEGEDLAQILKKEGPLGITRVVDLGVQICHALAEVHRQGIIHRDIKPDNLFAIPLPNGSEWIKLLDFGVAKFRIPSDDDRQLTEVGSAVGTPHYMAPEQILSVNTLDHRADIYSTGVVLYELMTGKRPYRTGNIAELVTIIAQGQPPLPRDLRPEIDRGLERVVMRAMALDKENRFESMFELAEALDPFMHGEDSRSEPIHAVKTIRTKIGKPKLPDLAKTTLDGENFDRTKSHQLFAEDDEERTKTAPNRRRPSEADLPQLFEGEDEEEDAKTTIERPRGSVSTDEESEDADSESDSEDEAEASPSSKLPHLYDDDGDEETLLSPVSELPLLGSEHLEDEIEEIDAIEEVEETPIPDSRDAHLHGLWDDEEEADKTIAMNMSERFEEGRASILAGETSSKQNRLALFIIVGLSLLAIVLSAIIGFFVAS